MDGSRDGNLDELAQRDSFYTEALEEFATPIAVMRQFAELLADGRAGELTEKQAEYLEFLLHSSEELALRFECFRACQELRHGVHPGGPDGITALEVLSRSESVLRARFARAGVSYRERLAGGLELCALQAPSGQVRSALGAMAARIARHASQGSLVEFSAAPAAGICTFRFECENERPNAADIAVFDGQREELGRRSLIRLFGIEMHFAHTVARSNGGTLTLKANSDGGALYTLTLPAVPHLGAPPPGRFKDTSKSLRK